MFALPTLIAPLLVAPAPAAAQPAPPVHCQVPCGIYGDHLRIELLREHATTIEKAMKEIERLSAEDKTGLNFNQMVRWISTKDEHAQVIQDQLAQYWLAQRIKKADPADESDAGKRARRRYSGQLFSLHEMTVAAMKCKQTVDVENVRSFRKALDTFKKAYFSAEDLKKLEERHDHDHSKDGSGGGGKKR
ncbi:MAG: superoxide dismutase [Ni] [Planctomycetota bacterium]